jgi:hypothetical protein
MPSSDIWRPTSTSSGSTPFDSVQARRAAWEVFSCLFLTAVTNGEPVSIREGSFFSLVLSLRLPWSCRSWSPNGASGCYKSGTEGRAQHCAEAGTSASYLRHEPSVRMTCLPKGVAALGIQFGPVRHNSRMVGKPEVILGPQTPWKKLPTPDASCDRRLTHHHAAGPWAADLLRVIN